MWLSRMSGRALPSPERRAYRFALPGLGSQLCAVIPSLAARNTTLPAARGWTSAWSPNPYRLMIVLSLADQDTARFDSRLPAASRRSARNIALSPTARSAVLGTMVTVATGAGAATLMLASPLFPSLVARSDASPGARARIKAEGPFALVIFTTAVSVLNHDTERLPRLFPTESRSCAVKAASSPVVRLALPGTTVTVATEADVEGPTVIVGCPVLPWLVAKTVALPCARPNARSPLHAPQG